MRSVILSLFVAATASTVPVSAQCLVPDGLSAPCFTAVNANLPAFPSYVMPGRAVCYSSCSPAGTPDIRWILGNPVQVDCGEYRADMRVIESATGVPQLFGTLTLDYSRTFEERSPLGQRYQVWRFLAKVDMAHFPSFPSNPCIVPHSLNFNPRVFYYGYVDYARSCVTGNWEVAAVLIHHYDHYIHDPAISSQPGPFHPTRAYALVAPHTPANPFVPNFNQAQQGQSTRASMRQTGDPFVPCWAEERSEARIEVLNDICPVPFGVQTQVTERAFKIESACGSRAESVDFSAAGLPWMHLATTSIGHWSTDFGYPGPEVVWLDEGMLLHFSPLDPMGQTLDVVYGASTAKGFQVVTISPQVFPTFPGENMTDLASNYSQGVSPGPVPPLVGHVMPTRHLMYLTFH